MDTETANIWVGGLYRFVVDFFDTTGMYPDHGEGESILWDLAIYVAIAFLVFWLVRLSIRIVKNIIGYDDF